MERISEEELQARIRNFVLWHCRSAWRSLNMDYGKFRSGSAVLCEEFSTGGFSHENVSIMTERDGDCCATTMSFTGGKLLAKFRVCKDGSVIVDCVVPMFKVFKRPTERHYALYSMIVIALEEAMHKNWE